MSYSTFITPLVYDLDEICRIVRQSKIYNTSGICLFASNTSSVFRDIYSIWVNNDDSVVHVDFLNWLSYLGIVDFNLARFATYYDKHHTSVIEILKYLINKIEAHNHGIDDSLIDILNI